MRTAIGICLFAVCSLYAGSAVSFSLAATTGDEDFDLTLTNINVEARQSMPSYYSAMQISFGASSGDVDRMLYHHGLSPADAFMVFRLSLLIGKPVDHVVVFYGKHKHKGWGAVAKSLGIKPGSSGFHQLKNGGGVVLTKAKEERAGLDLKITVGSGDKNSGAKPAKKAKTGGGGGGKGKGKK